jgi:ubiquinone/menaquinone biosynthesis C-methylase UbiE
LSLDRSQPKCIFEIEVVRAAVETNLNVSIILSGEISSVTNSDEMMNWYQIFTPDPQQRKSWYGSVAQAYDRLRPKYQQELLERAVSVATIPKNGRILEVGCGPGTATIAFAKMGFSIVCLEPSLDTCELARQNLAGYPKVEIIHTNFEEWKPTDRHFDAILAATSWHWIAPEHKHLKAASILKNRGSLILLWNTAMQPPMNIFENLANIFTQYVPTLAKYKSRETELNEISIFAASAIDSGLFSDLHEEYRSLDVIYPVDDYLQLLTTYSPCIALNSVSRAELLAKLRSILVQNCGNLVPLSYLSVFHILTKIT